MKKFLTVAVAMVALNAGAEGFSYPGNTWGTVVYAPSVQDGTPKLRAEGIIEQGVDWFRFGGGSWRFNTYGALEYQINSDNTQFTPVIGMKVNKRFTDGSLDLGIRLKSANTYIGPTGSGTAGSFERKTTTQLYATYWFDWNLRRGSTP